MIRMQIYLPEDLKRQLAVTAKQQGKPEAEIVRQYVADGLKRQPRSSETAGQALLRLAELGKRLDIRLPADASTYHDDYLYGDNA